jgi:hypothetical protein
MDMSKTARNAALAGLIGVLALGVVALISTGDSVAAKGGPSCNTCPRTCIACIDLWNPVICSDGHVYSNSCYAYVACATGCQPYGNGGPIAID